MTLMALPDLRQTTDLICWHSSNVRAIESWDAAWLSSMLELIRPVPCRRTRVKHALSPAVCLELVKLADIYRECKHIALSHTDYAI